MTTRFLERYPGRFDGGVAMCGMLAGGTQLWNSYLDVLFTIATLIAPEVATQLVHNTDPFAPIDTLRNALFAAQATPEGRAQRLLASPPKNRLRRPQQS